MAIMLAATACTSSSRATRGLDVTSNTPAGERTVNPIVRPGVPRGGRRTRTRVASRPGPATAAATATFTPSGKRSATSRAVPSKSSWDLGPSPAARSTNTSRRSRPAAIAAAMPSNPAKAPGAMRSACPLVATIWRSSRSNAASPRGIGLTAQTSERSSAAGTSARKAAGPPASMTRSWGAAKNAAASAITGNPSSSRAVRARMPISAWGPASPRRRARATGRPMAPQPMRPTRLPEAPAKLDHHRLAAVDDPRRAVHVARAIGDQEAHRVGDVVGGAETSRGDRLDELAEQSVWRNALGLGRGLQESVAARGLDATRRQAVHANPQGPQLHRELLAEHPDGGVAGAARRVQGDGLLGGTGDVDDAAASAPAHVRDDGPGAADVAEKLAVDGVDEGLVGQIDEGPEGRGARVVDEDVGAAQSLRRLVDETLTTGQAAEVGGNGHDVHAGRARDLVPSLLQLRLGARADGDAHTFVSQAAGDGQTDAFTGARHQPRLALQPQIHRPSPCGTGQTRDSRDPGIGGGQDLFAVARD